jgi:hypothetical protein
LCFAYFSLNYDVDAHMNIMRMGIAMTIALATFSLSTSSSKFRIKLKFVHFSLHMSYIVQSKELLFSSIGCFGGRFVLCVHDATRIMYSDELMMVHDPRGAELSQGGAYHLSTTIVGEIFRPLASLVFVDSTPDVGFPPSLCTPPSFPPPLCVVSPFFMRPFGDSHHAIASMSFTESPDYSIILSVLEFLLLTNFY